MLNVAEDVSSGKVDTADVLQKFEESCNISLVTDLGFNMYDDIDLLVVCSFFFGFCLIGVFK